MRTRRILFLSVATAALIACGSSSKTRHDAGTDGPGDGGWPDARIVLIDASAAVDGSSTDGGTMPDGGSACVQATCRGAVWACGNCIDDDSDGLVDSADPDCVGACDNNEAGYHLMIPGSETPDCLLDCYFDNDQGSGTDECAWNARCDVLEPQSPSCTYTGPTGSTRCPDTQSTVCHNTCGPVMPNGCDCFGCCDIGGRSVYLGSQPLDGAPACSAATVDNPNSCRSCTQVPSCLNSCERCEVCFGGTVEDLDCDCFDPAALPSRCVPGDGSDAGPSSQRCPVGRQPCGLPSDGACPDQHFCQTGCCTSFG